jgi:GAF domain-containing protein
LQLNSIIAGLNKEEKYQLLLQQAKGLTQDEPNQVANLANLAALLKSTFNFWWVGFYLVEQEELVLGPFQGPVACTRIGYGKGVCGSAWEAEKSFVVNDVLQFPGHIACSSESNSEIVVPVFDQNNKVGMVLDVDSEHFNHFDAIDQKYLEELCTLI